MRGWALLRSGLLVGMYILFYAALPGLDLSVIGAVYYTGPLLILVFSGVILRERVTPLQVLAVFVAFGGVLVILRPAGEHFSPAALIPLASAICYALAAVSPEDASGQRTPGT